MSNTSHLTNTQIAELKGLLLNHEQATKTRLATIQDGKTRAEHARDVLQQDADDAPQRNSDREVDLTLNDQSIVALERIHGALARIESDDYGSCVECGCDIPYARLHIEPETQHCVPCKESWEKRTGVVTNRKL